MPSRQNAQVVSTPHVATRELILDQTERLIAAKGVNGFTLRDIVEPLGMQITSVYKHYANRDDVLVALARRYITLLSGQFFYQARDLERPSATLRTVVMEYAHFHLAHPAYVRLALTDFATPDGGTEYIRLAAGGPFHSNLSSGPLLGMHQRLQKLAAAGHRKGEFRLVTGLDLLRVIKGALLVRLVFPDDLLVVEEKGGAAGELATWLWDVARGYVARRPRAAKGAFSLR